MRKKGVRFPQYLGWATWMDQRPGESAVQTVNRQITWDAIADGEIYFGEAIKNQKT